jgi:hypothetical protein
MKPIHIRRSYRSRKALGSLPDFDEIVQKALDDKQKQKEFKDVGERVAGSRKEQAAYQTISFSDLHTIEKDSIKAAKLVTKDKVFPVIDVITERQTGVSAGAVYLKTEIRKACAVKPPNAADKRAGFVKFIGKVSDDLGKCTTIAQIEDLLATYRQWNELEIIRYLVPVTLDGEVTLERASAKFKEHFGRISPWSVVSKVIVELCGKAFFNVLYKKSDSAEQTWKEARGYEAFSKEESDKVLLPYLERVQRDIDRNKSKLAEAIKGDEDFLKSQLTKFTNTGRYKKDLPAFQRMLKSYCENQLSKSEAMYQDPPKLYRARQDDWSWAELPTTTRAAGEKSGERQVNQGIPLSFIKRVGGLKIDDKLLQIAASTDTVSNPITSVFGFKSIQFGNYVKDREAKENIRHFLGAITDLAEALDVDLKQINQIGELSIAFGARGKGKASAHYEPGYKIINLTKGKGDGSLAHEWAHYLDNILTMIDSADKSKTNFASDVEKGKASYYETPQSKSVIINRRVDNAFVKIMDFIHRGEPVGSPPVNVRFFAIPAAGPYRIRSIDGSVKIVPMGTVEETFAHWTKQPYTIFRILETGKGRDDQAKAIGKLIYDLGLDHYDLPITIRSGSIYYYFSSIMKSDYWVKPWELFARAFETYIFDKLASKGKYNNFLVSETYFEPFTTRAGTVSVYPTGEERKRLFKLFDGFVEVFKEEYRIKPFTPFTPIREDEFIELDADDGSNVAVVVTEMPTVAATANAENGDAQDKAKRLRLMRMKAKALQLRLKLLSV